EEPDPLVLLREERAQPAEPRGAEREDGALLLVLDQLRLAVQAVDVRGLDGIASEDDAHGEGDPDRGDHDQPRGDEEPATERRKAPPKPHGATALYPAPRTVRIRSGRPSLRRSWPTWTSTVR